MPNINNKRKLHFIFFILGGRNTLKIRPKLGMSPLGSIGMLEQILKKLLPVAAKFFN
jgi:hypothetical protein